MKPSIGRFALLAAGATLAVGLAAPYAQAVPAKAIVWQTDYKKALAAAARKKTVLMIDFYSIG